LISAGNMDLKTLTEKGLFRQDLFYRLSAFTLKLPSLRERKEDVPLLLPNVNLFPIYALVGRAILMADREDAAGEELEKWRAES